MKKGSSNWQTSVHNSPYKNANFGESVLALHIVVFPAIITLILIANSMQEPIHHHCTDDKIMYFL